MNNKLDFNFTNAITVHPPYRRTSRIIPRVVIMGLLLMSISAFAVMKWDPAQRLFSEKPQTVYNPLYDEH